MEGLSSAKMPGHFGLEDNYISSAVNSYVYSTCRVVNDKLLKDFEADAVIEIQSIDFFAAITRVIQNEVDACVLAPIGYYSEKEWSKMFREKRMNNPWDTRATPRISHVKNSKYDYQKEVRCIWEAPVPLDLLNNPFLTRFIPYNDQEDLDVLSRVRSDALGSQIVPLLIKVPEARNYARLR